MEEKKRMVLTDSMSLKTIAAAIYEANLEYRRIVGNPAVIEYLLENRENIECMIKREGYSKGLNFLTNGFEFPSSKEFMVDGENGSTLIHVGRYDTSGRDIENLKNWEDGFIELELRIIEIKKK